MKLCYSKILFWITGLGISILAFPWRYFIDHQVNLTIIGSGFSPLHPLGVDNLGRDLLLRMHLAFFSNIIPLWSCVILAFFSGIVYTSIHIGFSRSFAFSKLIQLISLAIPTVPIGILIFLTATIMESHRFSGTLICIFLFTFFRTISFFMKIYERDKKTLFWINHELLGGGKWDRFWRYGIYSAWQQESLHLLILQIQIGMSLDISMSYLGFGAPEPFASFGNLFADNLKQILSGSGHIFPVVFVGFLFCFFFPRAVFLLHRTRMPTKFLIYD